MEIDGRSGIFPYHFNSLPHLTCATRHCIHSRPAFETMINDQTIQTGAEQPATGGITSYGPKFDVTYTDTSHGPVRGPFEPRTSVAADTT